MADFIGYFSLLVTKLLNGANFRIGKNKKLKIKNALNLIVIILIGHFI